uniref:Uncharacterized protein n=1 Tax=Romanomermis culicivorax TaxID=13658 RepID=A0A915IQD7_ROMCU
MLRKEKIVLLKLMLENKDQLIGKFYINIITRDKKRDVWNNISCLSVGFDPISEGKEKQYLRGKVNGNLKCETKKKLDKRNRLVLVIQTPK